MRAVRAMGEHRRFAPRGLTLSNNRYTFKCFFPAIKAKYRKRGMLNKSIADVAVCKRLYDETQQLIGDLKKHMKESR